MKHAARLLLALLLLAPLAGCAAKYESVSLPPHIDLREREMIGVIEFDSTSEGELAPLATRRFTESARRDQGLVRMIEIAPHNGRPQAHSPEVYRRLGKRHGVRTMLVGRLEISDVRPNLQIASTLRSGSLTALVDATLAVEMIETETGASIWNRSAKVTTEVGYISVFGDKEFVFNAEDPEQAYGALIDQLVNQVTRDFHVRWVRRPIAR